MDVHLNTCTIFNADNYLSGRRPFFDHLYQANLNLHLLVEKVVEYVICNFSFQMIYKISVLTEPEFCLVPFVVCLFFILV